MNNLNKPVTTKETLIAVGIFLVVLVFFSGCDGNNTFDKPNNKGDSLELYRCTSSQLINVEKEYSICIKSSYFSSYCFEQAKKSICLYIGKDEK